MSGILLFESREEAEKVIPLRVVKKVRIDKVVVCLARTSKQFFAFEEQCPHRSDDMSKGKINSQSEVVCPWHNYRFNLLSGEESSQRCRPLSVYPLQWIDDQLFIEI